jgi:hypothetical protein
VLEVAGKYKGQNNDLKIRKEPSIRTLSKTASTPALPILRKSRSSTFGTSRISTCERQNEEDEENLEHLNEHAVDESLQNNNEEGAI